MRLIYTLSLVSLLFFFGCDQDSGIISPVSLDNSPVYEGGNKLKYDVIESHEDHSTGVAPGNLYPAGADSIFIHLNLPPSEIPNLRVSKVIDGQDGGEIEFDYEYQTKDGNTITISAELEFEDGAFDGVEEIWMIFNNETATISFYPHLVFNEEVELEVEYSGLDLSGFNPNSVDFIFQNYDGTIENVEYDEIEIDVSNGTIELDDAELTHFSRYGFVN